MASSGRKTDDGEQVLWYFAYGSNMLAAKFVGDRGIVPRQTRVVRTPDWIASLDVPGLPYQEPTFLSLQRRHGNGSEVAATAAATSATKPLPETGLLHQSPSRPQSRDGTSYDTTAICDLPAAVGLAYLITAEQYLRVISSEGGGIAYADVQTAADTIPECCGGAPSQRIQVRTLVGILRRRPWPKPSARYMQIVKDGAREGGVPHDYQAYLDSIATYEAPSSWLGRIGAALFLGIFGPVMAAMEKLAHATIGADGQCPRVVIWLERMIMRLIWVSHDVFFAPIFGRGDGYEEQCLPGSDEESRLLEKPNPVSRDTISPDLQGTSV